MLEAWSHEHFQMADSLASELVEKLMKQHDVPKTLPELPVGDALHHMVAEFVCRKILLAVGAVATTEEASEED
ncbi:hypothetical protein Poly41_22910 [Novipirellula artificiosorum]|uniref:Uncharacterized protein n=2 Tax=Novipirellula artificiosorum TaxID=2528016 RepID=A0A5C6DU82_9BACT|nr:hypothetical protein Poly41_22910 [Novipirellula artificiosorum]